jgi:hypothetical protein
MVKDSHTPQMMKLQLLFLPVLLLTAAYDLVSRRALLAPMAVIVAFVLSTLPFVIRTCRKDLLIALLSPLLLAARASAQVIGVASGMINARRSAAAHIKQTHCLRPANK